jgi:hypothetical protein
LPAVAGRPASERALIVVPGRRPWQKVAVKLAVIGIGAAVGLCGALAAALLLGLQPLPRGECTPEGGLRCNGQVIQLCTGGHLVSVGTCAGGCTDQGGEVSCRDGTGSLVAPAGAACTPGMGMCAVEPANTLLVCRDGRLAAGARCPKACEDRGQGAALYCLDEADGIRFAEGFACPGFQKTDEIVCGANGKSLLRCKDGLLASYPDVTCHSCAQQRGGKLTCLDADGKRLHPATGESIPWQSEPTAP